MEEMTLRELCQTLNISRRAVQGYEKANLVHATGKNKMGYLLYNKDAQQRIRWISQLQQFGFQIKEIVHLMDIPTVELKPQLERQLQNLRQRQEALHTTIEELQKVIQSL